MVNHNIPSQWKEYCGKSKAWCDGFRKAVEKANEKEADPKLEAVLKEIGGVPQGSNSQGVPTDSDNNHFINPEKSAGVNQSPLYQYILAYGIIILFSLFVVGLCFTKYYSKTTKNSKNSSTKKSKKTKTTKNSKNSKPSKSKGKKASSSKARHSSAKTSRRQSKAKSSRKSTGKSKSYNQKTIS